MIPIPYELIRSRRKTVSIQIREDGRVIVRAPLRLPVRDIDRFVQSREAWILTHMEKARRQADSLKSRGLSPLSDRQLRDLARRARPVFAERTAHFAELAGVSYGRISIRCQHTRWGSCSAKGNLNFNCLLLLAPPQALDYVVVHELCHRIELNHSPRFWAQVERVMPDYRIWKKWLKEHGRELMQLLPA